MKILYGIQGTGHGHISRAREILPLLSEKAEVDVIISGYNCHMKLDSTDVIQKRGLSLAYDSRGSVSYLKTALQLKPITFIQDVQSINPTNYDLVISDYEPVTAWASLNSKTPGIALSHQASFLSKKSPRPNKKSFFAEQLLRNFAPCNQSIGFHFKRYDTFILPPIIRRDVLNIEPTRGDHITVYLPAFDHQLLIPIFHQFPEKEWHLFSPSCSKFFKDKNINVHPVGNESFLKSMKTGLGVVTSAGFETCAETMFLGKKLLTIPIRNQYEQHCNAEALKNMGVHVIYELDSTFREKIADWLKNAPIIPLNEVADTDRLTNKLIRYTRSINRSNSKGADLKGAA
tara:strand:- start:11764 stop:12798 length:1035 start_codon:yes stop_codon:yes gene_type:complete